MSFPRVHASDAMRVTNCLGDWLLALSRLCLHILARMGSQEGPYALSQDSASASPLDRQTWWSRVTNVGPVRHRAIDSSELRLTTDREKAAKWVSTGRTLWQQSAAHV